MTKRSTKSVNRKAAIHVLREHFPFALIHQLGCQGVAFFYKELVDERGYDPGKVMLVNGTQPKFGDDSVCGTCKKYLYPIDMQVEFLRRMQ